MSFLLSVRCDAAVVCFIKTRFIGLITFTVTQAPVSSIMVEWFVFCVLRYSERLLVSTKTFFFGALSKPAVSFQPKTVRPSLGEKGV